MAEDRVRVAQDQVAILAKQFADLLRAPRGPLDWDDPDNRERSRSFQRKGDADRFAVTVAADLLRGEYIDPRAGNITFKTYAEQWRKAQIDRDSTTASVEQHLRLHVYPTLGGRSLRSIRNSDIQALVRNSAGTCRHRPSRSSTGGLQRCWAQRCGIGRSPLRRAST